MKQTASGQRLRSAPDGMASDLAYRMENLLNAMENWCARLEDLADRLPDHVEPKECLLISRTICEDVRAAHNFEEKELFSALRRRAPLPDETEATLRRLQSEHWEDESYCEEIRERLAEFAFDRTRCNVESLAYMLRGFFESKRRHCAFEREHILPLLREGARAAHAR